MSIPAPQPIPAQNTAAGEISSRSRKRASAACTNCRGRRTKCNFTPNEKACDYCRKNDLDCIMTMDDKRKQSAASRANVNSLQQRLAALEALLPKQNLPPANGHDDPALSDSRISEEQKTGPTVDEQEPPSPQKQLSTFAGAYMLGKGCSDHPLSEDVPEYFTNSTFVSNHSRASVGGLATEDPLLPDLDHRNSGNATRGFDLQMSGKGRRYTMSDVSEKLSAREWPLGSDLKILENVPASFRETSLDLFWKHYNNFYHVVHRKAFLEDRHKGNHTFYSEFLNICMMIMGCKYCHSDNIDLPHPEIEKARNSLRNKAVLMADQSLLSPRTIPTVQAFLLLCGFELEWGKRELGVKYLNIACHLCLELGLHLQDIGDIHSDQNAHICHSVFSACVAQDRSCALFLGIPARMGNLGVKPLSYDSQDTYTGNYRLLGFETSFEFRVYEARQALVDIMGGVAKLLQDKTTRAEKSAYLAMARLDFRLNNWYESLPEILKWSSNNFPSSPRSFFVLHQLYHATLIVLHRPFTSYTNDRKALLRTTEIAADDSIIPSKAVTAQNALRITNIVKQYRQTFDSKDIIPSSPLRIANEALNAEQQLA